MRGYPDKKYTQIANIRISAEMQAALLRLAGEKGLSLSDFTRDVLQQYIDFTKGEQNVTAEG